ncbi:MAG: hypothetical protein IKW35_03870 [Paludibacteraceae bacterium]|nr:hypothetical protein [Paludibacteraceae bacterium]
MKRFFYIIVVLLICNQSGFAQIQIEEYGKAESMRKYEKKSSSIYWVEDGYYYSAWDYDCASYNLIGNNYCVLIYLGKDIEEVKRSKKILEDWFSKAENSNFIYVTNPNGQKVCLYKHNSLLFCSYGNEYLCKATIKKHKSSVATAVLAGLFTDAMTSAIIISSEYEAGRKELLANIEFGEHILTSGVYFKKELMRSFENFLEEKEHALENKIVSDLYTTRIINKIQSIQFLYKRKNLLESTIYQSFRSFANPYMRSDKHKDWLLIEQGCDVLENVVKGKTFFTKEEIEMELANASSTTEIEAIFQKYANRIY